MAELRDLEACLFEKIGSLKSLSSGFDVVKYVRFCKTSHYMQHEESVKEYFLQSFLSFVDSIEVHFPKNIFTDLFALFASLLQARNIEASVLILEKMQSLNQSFGISSKIRFSYIHDFIYGFDWERWVRKDPIHRMHVPPYSLKFLEYMENRGHELISLIAKNDSTYHPLKEDGFRNPYGFGRGLESETRLCIELVNRQLMPLPAWQANAYEWGKRRLAQSIAINEISFTEQRSLLAKELGL